MVGSIMDEKDSQSLANEQSRDDGPWHQGAKGERIAIRRSSRETRGAYAVVGSVAEPGSGVPLHLHKNEEEHFVVVENAYRFVCDDQMFDAAVGTSFTVPKGAKHAWRNISERPATGRRPPQPDTGPFNLPGGGAVFFSTKTHRKKTI